MIAIEEVRRYRGELPMSAVATFDRWRSEAAVTGTPAAAVAERLGVRTCREDLFEPSGCIHRGGDVVFDELAEALGRTAWPDRDRFVDHIFGHEDGSHVAAIIDSLEHARISGQWSADDELLARIIDRLKDGVASPQDEDYLRQVAAEGIEDDEILSQEERPPARKRRRPRTRSWHIVQALRWHPCASGILNIAPGERHLSVRCNGPDGRWRHLRFSRVAFWLNSRSLHALSSPALREAIENVAVNIDPYR